MTRISTRDTGYVTGQLSLFPEALDTPTQLYVAQNNAITTLKQSMSFTASYMVLEDASHFPDNGLVRVGPPPGKPGSAELIAYDGIQGTTLQNLQRAFAGSRQNPWPQGSYVTSGVMAEVHDAEKDAIINIENDLGTAQFPAATSLNGILLAQEARWLAPKPLFRAFPRVGPPPLKVRFQNFSTGEAIRFLWDFGDGALSVEKSPIHTYRAEGVYSVKLNMLTATGGQGIIEKLNYITASADATIQFFYVLPTVGYSVSTAQQMTLQGNPTDPTTFDFVDQTDGVIAQRYWVFGDGNFLLVDDGNVHTADHQYENPGEYNPSLLVILADQTQKRVFLSEKVLVL